MLNSNKSLRLGFFISLIFSFVLLCSFMFLNPISYVSADSSLSVADTASRIYSVGAWHQYDEARAENSNTYYGSVQIMYAIDTQNYNSNYTYGFFITLHDSYLQIKDEASSLSAYKEKLSSLNLGYLEGVADTTFSYNDDDNDSDY